MFTAYTPIDKCIGKELKVRSGGIDYVGLLSGVYTLQGVPMLVLTPMSEGGTELHIPLAGAVVTIRQG